MASNKCNGCTKRVVGCHATCETYKKWLENYQKDKKERQKRERKSKDFFYKTKNNAF